MDVIPWSKWEYPDDLNDVMVDKPDVDIFESSHDIFPSISHDLSAPLRMLRQELAAWINDENHLRFGRGCLSGCKLNQNGIHVDSIGCIYIINYIHTYLVSIQLHIKWDVSLYHQLRWYLEAKNGGVCHLNQHPSARIQKAHLRRLIVRRAADLKVPCGSDKNPMVIC